MSETPHHDFSAALTTCPFCGCGCGLYLENDGTGIIGVAPSDHHPTARGRLCARGWAAHEAVRWGRRLASPLLRRGASLVEVSWQEALTHVTARLSALRAARTPIGVLVSPRCTNEESYLLTCLARGALGTPHIDTFAAATYLPSLEGFRDVVGDPMPQGWLVDVARCDVALVVEGDVAESHPRAASLLLRSLRAGGRVIVIGSLRTHLARVASIHLQVPPGHEAAGLASLLEAVGSAQPRSPETVPNDLAAAELARAAEWIRGAASLAILLGPHWASPTRLRCEAALAATIAATSGHLGREGSVLLPLAARSNLRGAVEVGATSVLLPGFAPLDDADVRSRLQTAWRRTPNTDLGRGAAAVASLPALLIVGDEREAAASGRRDAEERFVVLLDAFMPRHPEDVDVALPIAGFSESLGTVTSADGRVQRLRPAAPPPGNARPGWHVLADLCARLGLETGFASADDVLDEIHRVVPAYARVHSDDLEHGWGVSTVAPVAARLSASPFSGVLPGAALTPVLAVSSAVDWGRDRLVADSPTLSREPRSDLRRFPAGVVHVSRAEADALGLRTGRQVHLATDRGEAVVPVVVDNDIDIGTWLVPISLRHPVVGLLAEDPIAVRVSNV